MAFITDFFVGTTKKFSVTIKLNGTVQNITGDTVTVRIKKKKGDADANAIVSKTADVASQGANGIATFTLVPDDTKAATPGKHFIDIEWITGTDEYVIYDNTVTLKNRISDVPA